ncbi:MAG: phosphatidylserine decarboxylase [Sedimentisphaerales bacterium]|nr:phosphatidylserine decarboxylase [Sedimentisphaerales bacterium]
MKMSITRYGMPHVVFVPLMLVALAVLMFVIWPAGLPWPQLVLVALALGSLAFFRDPSRRIPDEVYVLLAPADGKITDIMDIEENEFIRGPAVRIGIFLSVFDVHINRSPCRGIVRYSQAHPGKCLNALRWQAASRENQAHSLGLDCTRHPAEKVMVKQITGAIARRIVCGARVDDELAPGEKYGMIKLGSRTELFLPKNNQAQIVVKQGQKVKAGIDILVRYQDK